MMKRIKQNGIVLLCIAEAVIIACLGCTLFFGELSVRESLKSFFIGVSSQSVTDTSLDSVTWPEVKKSFAQTNEYYREREALFMTYGSEPVDLCCLGDSITQKFEWQDAFQDLRVANRGIGSDTTEGIIARLDSVVKLKPKVISLMVGINDLAQNKSPEEVAASYTELLERIQSELPETEIIVSSILPVTARSTVRIADIIETNQMLKSLCQEMGITYLDMYSDFADENGYLQPGFALDNVHLNVKGYGVWLSYLTEAFNS